MWSRAISGVRSMEMDLHVSEIALLSYYFSVCVRAARG